MRVDGWQGGVSGKRKEGEGTVGGAATICGRSSSNSRRCRSISASCDSMRESCSLVLMASTSAAVTSARPGLSSPFSSSFAASSLATPAGSSAPVLRLDEGAVASSLGDDGSVKVLVAISLVSPAGVSAVTGGASVAECSTSLPFVGVDPAGRASMGSGSVISPAQFRYKLCVLVSRSAEGLTCFSRGASTCH